MASLIKCRKCGGPHVTLKCGKDKTPEPVVKIEPKYEKIDKRKIVTVRLSNLPNDITVDELSDLMCEWGRIGRININSYNDTMSAFIDFYFKDEAEYFIKAIDRTPFDRMIITAELLI